MKANRALLTLLASALIPFSALAAEPKAVFSGPQPGERTTAFKSLEVRGTNSGRERMIIEENAGRPVALVFVHAIERSMAQILGIVDEYGDMRKERLRTEFVLGASRSCRLISVPKA